MNFLKIFTLSTALLTLSSCVNSTSIVPVKYPTSEFKAVDIPCYIEVGNEQPKTNGYDIDSYFAISAEIKGYYKTIGELRKDSNKNEYEVAFLKAIDMISKNDITLFPEIFRAEMYTKEQELSSHMVNSFNMFYTPSNDDEILFCRKTMSQYKFFLKANKTQLVVPIVGPFAKDEKGVYWRLVPNKTHSCEKLIGNWTRDSAYAQAYLKLPYSVPQKKYKYEIELTLDNKDVSIPIKFNGKKYPSLDYKKEYPEFRNDELAQFAMSYYKTLETKPFEEMAELYLGRYADCFIGEKSLEEQTKNSFRRNPDRKLVFIFNFEKAHIAVFKSKWGKYSTHTIVEENGQFYFTRFNCYGRWKQFFSKENTFIKSFLETDLSNN